MTTIDNQQRVSILSEIMAPLGFRLSKLHPSHRRGTKFTDLIIYRDDKSGDWVNFSFPNEKEAEQGIKITVQARFNNEINSPLWNSLDEAEEMVETWIQKCRSTN
jgi:hypothetical protein